MTAIIVSRFLLIAGVTHLAASVSLISYEDFSKLFIHITLAYRRIWWKKVEHWCVSAPLSDFLMLQTEKNPYIRQNQEFLWSSTKKMSNCHIWITLNNFKMVWPFAASRQKVKQTIIFGWLYWFPNCSNNLLKTHKYLGEIWPCNCTSIHIFWKKNYVYTGDLRMVLLLRTMHSRVITLWS